MVDVEGAVWYWYDRNTCTRQSKMSKEEYNEFKKIYGEGYIAPEHIKFLVENPVSPTAKSVIDFEKINGGVPSKHHALVKFKRSKKPV